MMLGELISRMELLREKFGDHEVWVLDSYGNTVYDAEDLRFHGEPYDDIPANVYIL